VPEETITIPRCIVEELLRQANIIANEDIDGLNHDDSWARCVGRCNGMALVMRATLTTYLDKR
jgi:hypothetical protein